MRLGERAAGHRHRQLQVVRRVGRDEVDRARLERRQDRERVADPQLEPGRVERPRSARVGRAEVGEVGPEAVALGRQVAHDVVVDGRPARVELDAERPPRAARDGRPEQRPADTRERVEDELAAAREELDQAGHQPRRLVRAVRPPRTMPELGRIGRRQQRFREVQPLLAGQLVERVGRVGLAPGVGHRTASLADAARRMPTCPPATRARASWAVTRRSRASRRGSTTPPAAGPGRSCSMGPRASASPASSTRPSSRMHALGEPMTVLRATAWPAWADEPYGPIVRAIGPTLRALSARRARRPARAGGARGRPAAARSRARSSTSSGRPRGAAAGPPRSAVRRGRSRASSGLLGRLGERRPVVLALEDLHRADAATRALVTFLARISRDQRLAIVGDAPARRRRSRRPVDGRPRRHRDRPASAGARRPARRSIATSWPRSSKASRANARRPACCSSSPSGRAACRS